MNAVWTRSTAQAPEGPRPALVSALGLAIVTGVPLAFAQQAAPSNVTTVASAPTGGFLSNVGQWPEAIKFALRRQNLVAHATDAGLWLQFHYRDASSNADARAVFHLAFDDSAAASVLNGVGELPGRHHFLLGADPDRWHTDVSSFAALRWHDVRPGVDFVLERSDGPALLQYALECAAGTGTQPLVFRLEGAEDLLVAPDGVLVARTVAGELRQSPPIAWEVAPDGSQRSRDAGFRLLGGARFAIEVPTRDDALPLRIDPGLEWSGYVGGSATDIPYGLCVSASGETFVVGETSSFDFPTTAGVLQPFHVPGSDGYVTKISADGSSIVFSTYLGGIGSEEARAVAVQGDVPVVVGETNSFDFPIGPDAWDGQIDVLEAFVLRLRPDGSALLSSTFLGGSAYDTARAVSTMPDGSIAIGGDTTSLDFPVTPGVVQSTLGSLGVEDAFVAIVSADGKSLLRATYLGGSEDEDTSDLAAGFGLVVIGGRTESADFPVTDGVFDPTYSPNPGAGSGFVTSLSASLDSYSFSSHLDGTSGSTQVRGVALAPSGRVAAVGVTQSWDFPTTSGAAHTGFGGSSDGFLTLFEADGKSAVYSTFIGTGAGSVADVELTAHVATVAGNTSASIPTTPGAYDTTKTGIWDAYVMRFRPDGSALLYGTAFGLPLGVAGAQKLQLDGTGRAIVLGQVTNDAAPVTPGSFDSTYAGGAGSGGWDEGFVAKFELQPIGVTAFGSPTEACQGPIRLTALGEPRAGNASFAIACTGAPPSAPGALVVGAVGGPSGVPLLGVLVYVDVAQPFLVRPALADAQGFEISALPLPPTAAGLVAAVQSVWIDTGGCGGTFALSASEALQISVAP